MLAGLENTREALYSIRYYLVEYLLLYLLILTPPHTLSPMRRPRQKTSIFCYSSFFPFIITLFIKSMLELAKAGIT